MTEKSPLTELIDLLDEQTHAACCDLIEWEKAYELAKQLRSWRGLMLFLNEHYPENVFPTLPDREGRDAGPRIISLIRTVSRLEEDVQHAVARNKELSSLLTEARGEIATLRQQNLPIEGQP